jgi:hypothetical protein
VSPRRTWTSDAAGRAAAAASNSSELDVQSEGALGRCARQIALHTFFAGGDLAIPLGEGAGHAIDQRAAGVGRGKRGIPPEIASRANERVHLRIRRDRAGQDQRNATGRDPHSHVFAAHLTVGATGAIVIGLQASPY